MVKFARDTFDLTDHDKKHIAELMQTKNNYESMSNIELTNNRKVNAKNINAGIFVTSDYSEYTIERPEILRLLTPKGGRRRRVRKTQRRKSTKRRHTRRYRRK